MGNPMKSAAFLLAALLAPGLAIAEPAEQKAGVTDYSKRFTDIPAPWKDYFEHAATAMDKPTGLERCLAFPDLPKVAWPQGFSQKLCRRTWELHEAEAGFRSLMRAGKTPELETLLSRYQSIHGAGAAPDNEKVHLLRWQFHSSDAETQKLAEEWVRASPNNPFAHAALGYVLLSRAADARGTKWARETPADALERMSELLRQANAEFNRAIELDPRTSDAYLGQMWISKLDSTIADGDMVFIAANAMQPHCLALAHQRMDNLVPRWGGSIQAMTNYANELKRMVPDNPPLENATWRPLVEMLRDLNTAKDPRSVEYAEELVRHIGIADALDTAIDTFDRTDPEPELRDWRTLAMKLQLSRYGRIEDGASFTVADFLIQRAPHAAGLFAQDVLDSSPDNPRAHYLLAASLYNTEHYEAASREYDIAMKDPDYRQRSLREVTQMWIQASHGTNGAETAKAHAYVEHLIKEYPKDGRARIYRIIVAANQSPEHKPPSAYFDDFLNIADPTDPLQEQWLQRFHWSKEHPKPKSN